MTSAAPLKPTTKALKALFLDAFTEFLLNISASLEVSITSIKFIVLYRCHECQLFSAIFFPWRVALSSNQAQKGTGNAQATM
jgi:hypothetical protein